MTQTRLYHSFSTTIGKTQTPEWWKPFTLAFILLFAVGSCQLVERMVDPEEEEIEEEQPPVTEAEPEPEPEVKERPTWYDPSERVREAGDTIVVTASAASPDSVDARTLAFESMDETTETAFNIAIDHVIQEENIDPDGPVTDQEKEFLLSILTWSSVNKVDDLAISEETFSHQSDENYHFYIKRLFLKTDMHAFVRDQF